MNAPTETLIKMIEIREKITRLQRTAVTLKNSNIVEVRLMIGSITPIVVCDAIFPIAEIKKGYAKAIRHRILELREELEVLTERLNELETEPKGWGIEYFTGIY